MKKNKRGYTAGVYDLFHIGHLNLLRRAKENCDYLIVGVSTNKLAEYRNKKTVIPYEERIEIVRAVRYVDEAVPQDNHDKIYAWEKFKFDVIFVGDDWKNTEEWNAYDVKFKELGVEVIYFPYTKNTSSTLINKTLLRLRNESGKI